MKHIYNIILEYHDISYQILSTTLNLEETQPVVQQPQKPGEIFHLRKYGAPVICELNIERDI